MFRRYCAQKFARFTDPDQLMQDARQQLALALQRRFERGAEEPLTEGYIMVAFRNAVTDLHRQHSGRAEPRSWLKAFGRLGQVLFELYCLARQQRADIITALASDPELVRVPSSADQARSLLDEMDRRGECEGKGHKEEPLFNQAGEPIEVPHPASPEDALIEAQSEGLQAYLFRKQSKSFSGIQHLVQRLQEARAQLRDRLELDDDQGFILQATLSGQLTEAEMGKMLGGLSVRQVRYKRQKALEKMKTLLKRAGLSLEELLVPDVAGTDSALYSARSGSSAASASAMLGD